MGNRFGCPYNFIKFSEVKMKILKEIKKYSIIAIVVCAVIGLLFVIFPAQCIKYISLAFGIALIVMGVAGVIGYATNKAGGFTLALSIVSAIAGVIICVKYQAIISVIVAIFGIFILATGLFNLATGIKVIASSLFSGWITLAMSVAEVVFGIIAITKSSQLTVGIVQFLGVALVLYAILDIVSFIQVNKLFGEAKNRLNKTGDIEVEGTIVEETDE